MTDLEQKFKDGELSGDLMWKAETIAGFMGLKNRRSVYSMMKTTRAPIYNRGRLCALKSELVKWMQGGPGRRPDPRVPKVQREADALQAEAAMLAAPDNPAKETSRPQRAPTPASARARR